ncbi:hypothetical protein [Burkholderia pseudomallei]|uniref:hypothetical protein n=1 Tax=Burkholderia pseudomallei TaxID=28450 RepID=UPI001F1E93D8|nr:hypothetical protein [Burkholderia pseudomallei]
MPRQGGATPLRASREGAPILGRRAWRERRRVNWSRAGAMSRREVPAAHGARRACRDGGAARANDGDSAEADANGQRDRGGDGEGKGAGGRAGEWACRRASKRAVPNARDRATIHFNREDVKT